MKRLALLLIVAGGCNAAAITWYGIAFGGQVDEITGPNPYQVPIGAPLLGSVSSGLEGWDGTDIELGIWFGSPYVLPPHQDVTMYGSSNLRIVVNPVPWMFEGIDGWSAHIEQGGQIASFYASSGYCSQIFEESDGSHRFALSDCVSIGGPAETIISGGITRLGPLQEVPEPAAWMLAGSALLALAIGRRMRSNRAG